MTDSGDSAARSGLPRKAWIGVLGVVVLGALHVSALFVALWVGLASRNGKATGRVHRFA